MLFRSGDELIGALEFANDSALLAEEVGHNASLETLPLELVAGVEDAVARGEFVLGLNVLAPIRQAPKRVGYCRVPSPITKKPAQ